MKAFLARVWFREAPATRLAFVRIATALYVLHLLVDNHRTYMHLDMAGADTFEPTGAARLLSGPLDPDIWWWIVAISIMGVAFNLLGLAHRLALPFGAALTFTLAYRNSWGQVYHLDNLPVLFTLCCALSPSMAAWSVDAWLRRRWPDNPLVRLLTCPGAEPGESSWWYGWGLQMMAGVVACAYFVAGTAKVTSKVGWRWALGTNLADQITYDALYKELLHPDGGARLAWIVYDFPLLMACFATVALVVELGAPLALLHRRIAHLFCLLALGMHWGIAAFMDIHFPFQEWGFAYLPFLAPEKPVEWLKGHLSSWERSSSA
jgi:hypothetical protein